MKYFFNRKFQKFFQTGLTRREIFFENKKLISIQMLCLCNFIDIETFSGMKTVFSFLFGLQRKWNFLIQV